MALFSSKPEILAIDDDESILRVIKIALAPYPYKFVATSDPFKTGNLIKPNKTKLILLDWMLDNVNGIDILSQIKNFKKFQNIPVIMITAKNMMSDMEEAYRIGADGFITKPLDPASLGERIMNLFEKIKNNEMVKGAS